MPTRSSTPSGRVLVDTLLSGSEWKGRLSWSLSSDPEGYLGASTLAPGRALEPAAAAALAEVASFTRLRVVEDRAEPDVRIFSGEWMSFSNAGRPTTVTLGGYAFFPGDSAVAGDIWLGPEVTGSLTAGTYGYRTLLHEVGHALGLKQPDEAGSFGRLAPSLDGAEWSVMSARGVAGGPVGALGLDPQGYAEGFMIRDIAALQHLYGANYADRTNDVYTFDPNERVIARTIWDGGGNDTYDFSRYATRLTISLEPGGWSTTGQEAQLNRADELGTGAAPIYASGSVYNAGLHEGRWLSGIENAIGGSANDTIVGNRLGNTLWGGNGDDTIVAGGGRDTVSGGRGDDRIDAGSGADLAKGHAGDDTIRGRSGDDTLFGGDGDDILLGGSHDDVLVGGDGRDVIEGGSGADWLSGGDGDDRLIGGTGDDILVGGTGDDQLVGGAGADLFDLRGRPGSDIVADFVPGEDRVLVASPADAFASAFADGTDTLVQVSPFGDVVRLVGILPSALSVDDFTSLA